MARTKKKSEEVKGVKQVRSKGKSVKSKKDKLDTAIDDLLLDSSTEMVEVEMSRSNKNKPKTKLYTKEEAEEILRSGVKVGSNRYKPIPVEKVFEKIEEDCFITSIVDCYNAIGMSKKGFYSKYTKEELEEITERLEQNKGKIKAFLRKKLANSNSLAALIALYKLLGTQEERMALSQSSFNTVINNATQKDNTVEIKVE